MLPIDGTIKDEAHGWKKVWAWNGMDWVEVYTPPEGYVTPNPYDGTGETPESETVHPDNYIGYGEEA